MRKVRRSFAGFRTFTGINFCSVIRRSAWHG
jgi:hypothetical protein